MFVASLLQVIVLNPTVRSGDRSRIENDQWQRERDQLRREKDQLRRERDQLRRDIRHWLSPPNPSTNHNTFLTAPSARHRRTAVWFVENNYFVEWKKRGSLLWVHGKRLSLSPAGVLPHLQLLSYSGLRQKHASVCSIHFSTYVFKVIDIFN